MKKNFSGGEIGHIWAQRNHPEGKAGNLYFAGDTIYSYGTHFPIARFVDHGTGKAKRTCILFTTRTYSPTTSGHVSAVRQAIRGLAYPVFHVDRPDNTPAECFSDLRDKANAALAKAEATPARYAQKHIDAAYRYAEIANGLATFFHLGVRARLPKPDALPEWMVDARDAADRHAATVAHLRETKAVRAAAREEAYREATRGALAAWQAGQDYIIATDGKKYSTVSCISGWGSPAYLRLRPDGVTVQTSRGAEVPAEHVERAYRLLAKLHNAGGEYKANGHTIHLGAYSLDSMDTAGTIRAGCHTFQWNEVERFAASMGWN